jgi:hypothetical protein
MSSASVGSSSSAVRDDSNLPPPIQTGVIIPVPAGTSDNHDDFIDNYDLDAEGGDDYTLGQKMVHYCGGHISSEHLIACKAVLVFHAGAATSKLNSMTKVVKESAMLALYTASIAALDEVHFGDSARKFFSRSFRKKDEPMTAESLYRYYLDSRLKMRNVLLPLFPKNLVTMKSGKGFHDSCNDVFVAAYRAEMSKVKRGVGLKYTQEEVDGMLPPHLWEFSKAPWYFGLAMKIFRRDPQLAPNVAEVLTDIANLPISRAEMKRKKQEATAALYSSNSKKKNKANSFGTPATPNWNDNVSVAANAVSVSASAAMIEHNKKVLWAKVLASKAQAENTNIAKRMGKMEELEKAMALLEKMRPVIGEEIYAAKVQCVLAAFPVFASFDACVDIIDVEASPPVDPDVPCILSTPATNKQVHIDDDVNIEVLTYDARRDASLLDLAIPRAIDLITLATREAMERGERIEDADENAEDEF